jgi:hypothetical protein
MDRLGGLPTGPLLSTKASRKHNRDTPPRPSPKPMGPASGARAVAADPSETVSDDSSHPGGLHGPSVLACLENQVAEMDRMEGIQ